MHFHNPAVPIIDTYADAACRFGAGGFAGLSAEGFSRAFVDPSNAAWIDGYVLCHLRAGWRWSDRRLQGEVLLTVKNLNDAAYIAFSEPDPDGNSYQPAATAEWSLSLRLGLG